TASVPRGRRSRCSAVSAACYTPSSPASSCGSSPVLCAPADHQSETRSTEVDQAFPRFRSPRGKELPRNRRRLWGSSAWRCGPRAWTLLSGSASLRDARGDELHGGFSLQRGAASERIRGGIDELFAAARVASDAGDLFGSAGFGGSAGLPLRRQGVRVSYEVSHLLAAGALPADTADWSHRLALVYETPCRCAGI